MILYLVELAVAIIAIIVSLIVLRKKETKKFITAFIIILALLVVSEGVTFALEKPVIEIKKENTTVEAKVDNHLKIAKTTYHFQDITGEVEIEGKVDYNQIGSYEISYKIPTLFGVYKETEVINVVDTTPPEINLEGGEEYNQSYSKEYQEPGYSAIDVYDENLTEKVQVEKNQISDTEMELKYTVSDNSGNTATKTRKVHIVDDIAPNITLNGSETMTLIIGNKYEEKGAKAVDEKDGDLTDKIQKEGSVDTSKEGNYEITYKVSDSKGNEATKKRKIIVLKEEIKARTGTDGQPGVIYLTFDDGPSSSITPKILDILKQKNVKATFFILNYNAQGEALVKREIAEGHTVGIHGFSHDYNTIYQSVDTYMSNITKLQEKIKASTGYNATITRFPGGSSNTVSRYNPGIMTILCKEVVNRGYRYFDWNVSSGDAGDVSTSQGVYNNVTKGLSKSRSNVVLMHDFSGNTKTLNALSSIIDYGIQNGYTFSNITTNTPMVTHKPNN